MTSVGTAGIILAAGKGTRLKSDLPKVLHRAAGRPLLNWVIQALRDAGVSPACLVLSEDHQAFAQLLAAHPDLRVAVQKNRLGTGDAVAAAAYAFEGAEPAPYAAGHSKSDRGPPIACKQVLIAAGDVPAIRAAELRAFIAAFEASGAAVGVLGMRLGEPRGYGRIVQDGAGDVRAIVEERDADAETRALHLCNTGMIVARTADLFPLLHRLTPANAQREYYLTDMVGLAHGAGLGAMVYEAEEPRDYAGVNDRRQLAAIESWLVARVVAGLMERGVSFRLPETTMVEADVQADADVDIGPGCSLMGKTVIGGGAQLGAGVVAVDVEIGSEAKIGAGSYLCGGMVRPGEVVAPHAVRID